MQTPRHALPQLVLAQAQKEITHNEALTRIDALLHPVVEARLGTPPAALTSAQSGQCWLVDANASGDWQTRENEIAYWTGESWRFLVPTDGMLVRDRLSYNMLIFRNNDWISGPMIADPTGGLNIDAECRTALVLLLAHLRLTGLLSF